MVYNSYKPQVAERVQLYYNYKEKKHIVQLNSHTKKVIQFSRISN